VLKLCYLGDLSIDQAAEALGIPIGTAKSRLSRGKSHLRHQLGDRVSFDAAVPATRLHEGTT